MPTKTNNRKITQRAGKGSEIRGAKPNTVRQRRKTAQADSPIIADSIFNLKIESKKGADVFFTLKGHEADHKSATAMYNDLYASFENLYRQITGRETADVYKCGLALPVAFDHILCELKMGILPSGYKFNIEFDEHCQTAQQYYFVIYQACRWNNWWHCLEVGKALAKLRRNKSLHDLFLSFLKSFCKCGVDLWDEGHLGNTLEFLDELSYDNEIEGEDGLNPVVKETIDKYEKGEPSKYAKLIRKAKNIPLSDLQLRVKRFRNDSQIANLIFQGCEIMKTSRSLNDYRYEPEEEEDGYDFYLDLNAQCNIIWDWNDALSEEHKITLDNDANNGYVQSPVWSREIRANTKNIDFAKFLEEISWPIQLSQFFTRADDLINDYIK